MIKKRREGTFGQAWKFLFINTHNAVVLIQNTKYIVFTKSIVDRYRYLTCM